jgi:homoserine dehydrogenase
VAINVALLGFGTVGSATYRLISKKAKEIEALIGEKVLVTDIIIKNEEKHQLLKSEANVTTDFLSVIHQKPIDIVIEAIVGMEPAYSYLLQALNKGIPVITANKALFAQKGAAFREIAIKDNIPIGYEATVAGGVPIIRTSRDLVHVNSVTRVEGILNGTTNFIMSDMRVNRRPFKDSLRLAQEKGYAEADPTNDIEGIDAFYKLIILCDTVFGKHPDWAEVTRLGIEHIDLATVKRAEEKGERIKLIAEAELNPDGSITAKVLPKSIGAEHPLYGVEGVDNAITLHTDLLHQLTLKGPGAGGNPTASAIVSDLVNILPIIIQKRQEKKLVGA